MNTGTETLPDDIEALKAALLAERAARRESEARATGAEAMVAHLKLVIAKLRHDRFGTSSEHGRKLLDQMELQLEELEATASEAATAAAPESSSVTAFTRRKPVRAPLPGHLPREARGHRSHRRLFVLRRHACQARRDGHRDLGGRSAAVEGRPDRARDVHLPVL